MNWVEGQNKIFLESKGVWAEGIELITAPQLGIGVEDVWTNKYVYSAYQQGIFRARRELQKSGYKVPSIAESGGLGVALNQPMHIDRLGLVYSRTYEELKGINASMSSQISRVLSQGMAEGRNPRELAIILASTVMGPVGGLGITDTLGRFIPAARRAEIMARTEIIRAHHVATIQEYRNWGLEGVQVQGEWATVGDDRVCDECAELHGKVFPLDEIESMIPVHPQCRCIALPVEVKEDGEATMIAIDPVARNMDPDVAREYLGYKDTYRSWWDDIEKKYPDSWNELKQGLVSPFGADAAFYDSAKQIVKEMDPDIMNVLSAWKADAQNVGPLLLKRMATLLEKGKNLSTRYNLSSPAGTINIIESLTKTKLKDPKLDVLNDLFGGVPPGSLIKNKTGYLKLRAFNQAFMEKRGIEKVTLYRGVGGRGEGQALAEAIKSQKQNIAKEQFARTKFTYQEAPLVGFSDDKEAAQIFGSFKQGFAYEKEVSASDIFLHRDLLDGLLRGGMGEREYIVFGGDVSITLDKVF